MIRQSLKPTRLAVLGALLIFALLQLPGASRALDIFDARPPLRILFIGNSHTHANNMPDMVRRIADSAGVKQRYDITMHAPGGARFKDHWANERVHALLGKPWDHIILQGASGEPLYKNSISSLQKFGARLGAKANATGARLWLFVKGGYGPKNEWTLGNPEYRDDVKGWVQEVYGDLAKTTGASLINVDKRWHETFDAGPGFELYEPDHNHPSVHGTYLVALLMFGHISGESPEIATWRPSGVSESEAAFLRKAAAN